MAKSMPIQKPGRSEQAVCTPMDLLQAVKFRLGIDAFACDLAASRENTVAAKFYSVRANALEQSWVFPGVCWLNPPFGDLAAWVKKASEEAKRGAKIAMLVPAAVGANWWRDSVHLQCSVLFLNGRLTFVGHKQPYPKDCALLIYGLGARGYTVWSWQVTPA